MTPVHLLTPLNNKVYITLKKQVRSKVGRPNVREQQTYICHECGSPRPVGPSSLFIIYFYLFIFIIIIILMFRFISF